MNENEVIDWLLQGDPAIRWQVLQQVGAPDEAVESERRRVANEGWGAQLLACQDEAGTWGGGLYTPKWTSTTYTLLLLRSFGLPAAAPQAQRGLERLIAGGNFSRGGINLWRTVRYSDLCVDAMTLALLAYFRYPGSWAQQLAGHLLAHQMADGGWNCLWYRQATHSSFHTTLSVLEALAEYAVLAPDQADWDAVARRGEEFLLVHRLFRSHRSGAVVDERMLRCSFPPRWRYDILRALDYFCLRRRPYDERMQDALDILRQKRRPDGRWKLENRHAGLTFFEMEKAGQPSRWNTLRAQRVLRWFGQD